MTLFWAFAPAALAFPGYDGARGPARSPGEISRSGNAESSQCTMSPPWRGRGGARGGYLLKKDFSQVKKNQFNEKVRGFWFPERYSSFRNIAPGGTINNRLPVRFSRGRMDVPV
jgi:hypothetical protein